MPFQKGNTIWKEGVAVKKEKTLKMDQFLMILGNGGMVKYADIMDKIAKGEEPTKAEVEFMDRCEGWREYIKPKLARQELTGKDGEKFEGVHVYLPGNAKDLEATSKTGESSA